MKFNAVLMTLDQNTKIRLVVTMYGMKFSSEHYPEYYLDHKESDELLDKVVVDMRVKILRQTLKQVQFTMQNRQHLVIWQVVLV